ncbi:hypothetical protein K435DRAFT_871496 [Dendrothele bispora CBS 962.96]|uniref:Uncharacterized protein n=1 Tax=Dendrothele bispora (strain CBS 962.96) TaxID=1314807 RepID=A0A4S8L3V4_DENBC|nr:hypothetical protein K435DRAFT_871496 [Dendrothele bispora CBS 962.96]
MSNAFCSQYETTSVVDPTPTIYDSATAQPPNLRNRANTRSVCQIYTQNNEAPTNERSTPVQSPPLSYAVVIATRESTQFDETSKTQGAPDHSGESPKLLFTVSHFRDKIIIDSMAIDSKDAPVISIHSNGLTIASVSLKKSKSKSRVTSTTYKSLRAFIRTLFLPCAFIMVLLFPDIYPAMVDWLQEQTDAFAFFGTGMQHAASSKLAAAVLQYVVFAFIVTMSVH